MEHTLQGSSTPNEGSAKVGMTELVISWTGDVGWETPTQALHMVPMHTWPTMSHKSKLSGMQQRARGWAECASERGSDALPGSGRFAEGSEVQLTVTRRNHGSMVCYECTYELVE